MKDTRFVQTPKKCLKREGSATEFLCCSGGLRTECRGMRVTRWESRSRSCGVEVEESRSRGGGVGVAECGSRKILSRLYYFKVA